MKVEKTAVSLVDDRSLKLKCHRSWFSQVAVLTGRNFKASYELGNLKKWPLTVSMGARFNRVFL